MTRTLTVLPARTFTLAGFTLAPGALMRYRPGGTRNVFDALAVLRNFLPVTVYEPVPVRTTLIRPLCAFFVTAACAPAACSAGSGTPRTPAR